MRHYVYRHIRPDKNEPFYIGVGTKTTKHLHTFCDEYKRAHIRANRSLLWTRIYNKNNRKIEIDILWESDDYTEVKNKEIEFIALYGRKDTKTGPLVNHNPGGGGIDIKGVGSPMFGRHHTDETKKQMSIKRSGKNHHLYGKHHTKEANDKNRIAHMGRNNIRSKKVNQYTLDGILLRTWDSAREAERELNIAHAGIGKCCVGQRKTTAGFA